MEEGESSWISQSAHCGWKKIQSTKNFSTFDGIPECEDVVGRGIIIGAGTVGQSQGRVRLMLAQPLVISISLRAII